MRLFLVHLEPHEAEPLTFFSRNHPRFTWSRVEEAAVFTSRESADVVARDMGGKVVEFRLVESCGSQWVDLSRVSDRDIEFADDGAPEDRDGMSLHADLFYGTGDDHRGAARLRAWLLEKCGGAR